MLAICCSSRSLRCSCSLRTAGDMHIDKSNKRITLEQMRKTVHLNEPKDFILLRLNSRSSSYVLDFHVSTSVYWIFYPQFMIFHLFYFQLSMHRLTWDMSKTTNVSPQKKLEKLWGGQTSILVATLIMLWQDVPQGTPG